MEIQVEKLPKALRKKGLGEKLTEICGRNDVIFMEVFGSLSGENIIRKAMLISQLNLIRVKRNRF